MNLFIIFFLNLKNLLTSKNLEIFPSYFYNLIYLLKRINLFRFWIKNASKVDGKVTIHCIVSFVFYNGMLKW